MKFSSLALIGLLFCGCAHNQLPTTPEQPTQPKTIDNPPLDANLPRAEVLFATPGDLPEPDSVKARFNEGLAWAQACAINPDSCGDSAYIEIDEWEVWELDPKTHQSVLIYREDYGGDSLRDLNQDEGGVYTRYPSWYADDQHRPMDYPISAIAAGSLCVYPMAARDGICHWWTPRLQLKQDRGYFIKVLVRVSGDAAVQFGFDFWIGGSQWGGNDVNNYRSWNSGWYGTQSMVYLGTSPDGKFYMVIICPLYLFP